MYFFAILFRKSYTSQKYMGILGILQMNAQTEQKSADWLIKFVIQNSYSIFMIKN